MLTDLQKRAAKAIVTIFETGTPRGRYDQVTLLPGDTGHLTYGKAQTTLASGNLHLLMRAYCDAPEAALAEVLSSYLPRLADRDLSLDHDFSFRTLLKDAGQDPVMQSVQDDFFDRVYWKPAEAAARGLSITTPLGTAVVYDSWIHGSWTRIRDRTTKVLGPAKQVGEQAWVARYVEERRDWLGNHSNRLLQRTVYRMDAFRQLMKEDRWKLKLPFKVRGIVVDREALLGETPVRISAWDPSERTLRLEMPYLVGPDVRRIQEPLVELGYLVRTDGIYGPLTEGAVRSFQLDRGLVVDGVVGPATRGALGV